MKYLTIIIFVWVPIFTQSASAQNLFGLLNDGQSIMSAGINANPNLNANADYLFAFEQREGTVQRFGIITQANFPLFSQKGFDFDFRFGVGALLSISDKFKSLAGVSWNFSRTSDLNGRYFHSGFKLDILPGYYGSKWVFTPHLSLNYQPFIHIRHSDYAKRAFKDLYPGGEGPFKAPKDGWFSQNNLTLQTGIGIAYFQPKWHVNLTAGFQHQPNRLGLIALPDIGAMPFYGGVNFGYAITDK
mgnify:FL=1